MCHDDEYNSNFNSIKRLFANVFQRDQRDRVVVDTEDDLRVGATALFTHEAPM